MRNRGRLRAVGLAMMALGAVPVAATSAATSDAAGWWSRTASPAPLDPTAARVEAGQLLVEGGGGGATAFTALRFTLEEGESAPSLTLTPLEGSVVPPDAVLQACAVTGPWDEAAGGSFDDAPTYDCATSSDGVVATDGSSIQLDLAPLLQGTTLDVALVPGASSPPFSLKIDRVAAGTLTTSADAGSSSGASDGGSPSFGSGTSSAPSSSGSSFAAPSAGTPTFDAPASPAPATPAETSAGGSGDAVAETAAPVFAGSRSGGDSDRVRNLGIAILLAGVAVCGWAWIATSSAATPVAAPTEAPEGGRRFGRFARPVAEA